VRAGNGEGIGFEGIEFEGVVVVIEVGTVVDAFG
jgi:hypothetical protein